MRRVALRITIRKRQHEITLYSSHKPGTMKTYFQRVSNSVVEYSAFNRLAVGSNPT